jgi:peptidyl-tRNA hydrolase, PTH1 family
MKVIVGLGNPGEKYSGNRHNVGFMVVDALAKLVENTLWSESKKFKAGVLQTKEFMLVKPQTFMNDSGLSVVAICQFYKVALTDLYIVHDDLDIQIGNYKIQHGKGPQVHNGLRSVEEKLGSDQFWNVRVGVENREVRGNKGVPGVVYSLQDFNTEEQQLVEDVITKIVDELRRVLFL